MKLDLDQLRDLIRLLDEANLTEIEVEQDDDRIRVRREPAPVVSAEGFMSPNEPARATRPIPPAKDASSADDQSYVTSPFVGTFYRAPTPDGEPFVEIGDAVTPGQVLCIVEAMKLMNEIEAELAGTVVEVFVDNGKAVEFGDRLFRIEPD